MTPYYPCMTFKPSDALHSGLCFFLLPNLVATGHFLRYLTSGWPRLDPCMPFDLSNELHVDQGFFLPNLVTIRHFQAIWPLVDPSWPQHDLWPQHCISLWSGVLPTKFGSHKALLSKLTPTWPQLTPTWPLTPAMHYALVRCFSYQTWWP